MKLSSTYKLEYPERGGFYTSKSDFRRFVTMDYNLERYIGIVGNGIVDGWLIEEVSGLTVRVTPGTGFIGSLFTESPWALDGTTNTPKTRSQATADGDVIISEIPGWSNPNSTEWTGVFYPEGGSSPEEGRAFDQLGPEGEDVDYDGIVEGVLEPKYKALPDDFLDDPYVKSAPSTMHQVILTNNRDNYIFARRADDEPYNTFAEFFVSNTNISSSANILIARVVARSNAVASTDYSSTIRLNSFEGAVSTYGKFLLNEHNHGGSKTYDPPRIRLNTDKRECKMVYYNEEERKATYEILPSFETSVVNDHKHTYEVDEDGNGATISLVGDVPFHYHKILANVVGEPITGYDSVLVSHTHELSESVDTFSETSDLRVLVNNVEIDPSLYTIDFTKGYKLVRFEEGVINSILPLYSSSFPFDGPRSSLSDRVYSFSMRTASIQKFINKMIVDFDSTYRDEMSYLSPEALQEEEDTGPDKEATVRPPFAFWEVQELDSRGRRVSLDDQNVEPGSDWYVYADPTPITVEPQGERFANVLQFYRQGTSAVGIARVGTGNLVESGSRTFNLSVVGFVTPLKQQSKMAALELEEKGDEFLLLPPLARFIPIRLENTPSADEVVVEILENVEVQGVLEPGSLSFIRAEKFELGTFLPARIPFIDHIGRILESYSPLKLESRTEDGIGYQIIPSLTSTSSGHAHRAFVNELSNGVTLATTVDGELSVFVMNNGAPLRISHTHLIADGDVDSRADANINTWQGASSATEHSPSC